MRQCKRNWKKRFFQVKLISSIGPCEKVSFTIIVKGKAQVYGVINASLRFLVLLGTWTVESVYTRKKWLVIARKTKLKKIFINNDSALSTGYAMKVIQRVYCKYFYSNQLTQMEGSHLNLI